MSPSIAGATTPEPTSPGTSRSRRRRPGRWPSPRASVRWPARRRSRPRRRRRRCARSARPAGVRAGRSRPGDATGRRTSAARRTAPPTASGGPTRRLPRPAGPEQLDGLVGRDRAGHAEPDEPAARRPSAHRARARAARPRRPLRQDGEALEGQVGVDVVDARDRAAHGAADSPPVRIARTRRPTRGLGKLTTDPVQQSGGQRLVAEIVPDCIASPCRARSRDPASAARSGAASRFGPPAPRDRAPGRGDRSADVRAVGRDAVERGRRPEVHDHGRRPYRRGRRGR